MGGYKEERKFAKSWSDGQPGNEILVILLVSAVIVELL